MLPLKKVKCLPTKVFGVFALEVNEILQGDASEIEKGNGNVRQRDDDNILYRVQQYYTSTRTYSSLEPLVPGAAAYLVPGTRYMQAPDYRIRGTGVCFARKNSL